MPKYCEESNLALFVAGKTDLRTNLFQLGEDDTFLISSKHGVGKSKKTMDGHGAKGAWKLNQGAKGDLVWIHLRKERFPNERKSKLMPRIDGPFKVIKKLNDNAYQLDLQGKYTVSPSFNITDLSPYFAEETDLRTNPFQVGKDDESITSLEQHNHEEDHEDKEEIVPKPHEDLEVPLGVITRSKQAKLKTTLQHLLNTIQGSLVCANPTTLVVIQAT